MKPRIWSLALAIAGLLGAIIAGVWFARVVDPHSWSDAPIWAPILLAAVGVTGLIAGLVGYARALRGEGASPATFLSDEDEDKITDAIEAFEKRTSGELRVHLERKLHKPILEQAQEVFHRLGLTETRDRNAVLFFVAVSDHKFAVLGDSGINQKVAPDFWEEIVKHVHDRFVKREFGDGLVEGIRMAGEALVTHFPPRADDKNELPNEISK